MAFVLDENSVNKLINFVDAHVRRDGCDHTRIDLLRNGVVSITSTG